MSALWTSAEIAWSVDGTKVSRARLRDGAVIRIGHTEMTVRIDGGRDEAGGWNV